MVHSSIHQQPNPESENMTEIKSPISLVDVAKNYGGFPQQMKALTYLQTAIYDKSQHGSIGWTFSRMYRDNTNGTPIDFIKVMEYFANLPHQVNALLYLENNTKISVLQEFANIWRTKETSLEVNLDLPWTPQTDSIYVSQANRMCFSSSVYMCAAFQFPEFKEKFSNDDAYLAYMLQFGDTTEGFAHVQALESLGLNPTFSTKLNLSQAIDLLNKKIPIAIGILHRGDVLSPTGGGHYIALKGYTEDRDKFYVNDPYGTLKDGYSSSVANGKNAVYDRYTLNHRWTVENPHDDDRSGWGLYITPKE